MIQAINITLGFVVVVVFQKQHVVKKSSRTNVKQSLLLQINPLRYPVSHQGILTVINKKDEALRFLEEVG